MVPDVDFDDATICHSQREDLFVGQSSSSVSDRSGQPLVESQELNTTRTEQDPFGPTEGANLADCQEEIKKHEFLATYDRRNKQKQSETIGFSDEKNFIGLFFFAQN